MINIPIWAFVIMCILSFIGLIVVIIFLLGLSLIFVDISMRNRNEEEKLAEQCPYEVEERKENNETKVL